jgi:hypothetical protein
VYYTGALNKFTRRHGRFHLPKLPTVLKEP